MPRSAVVLVLIGLAGPGLFGGAPEPRTGARGPAGRAAIELQPCPDTEPGDGRLCGTYEVPERRGKRARGRRIGLRIVVLQARGSKPRPDPILYLAGGPGGSATVRADTFADSWMRDERDIVLIDQRGTGESNPLGCELPGSVDDLQGYLDGDFSAPRHYRRCKRQLRKVADLRLYTTPIAVDDLDEVRAALGYESVNLVGNSWGTRTALVYMRRHPQAVRTAVLNSIVPLAIIYPLYHAQGAQGAIDTVLAECAADAACSAAFPNVAEELTGLFEELDRGPKRVTVHHPDTDEPVEVSFSRESLADGVRYLMQSVSLTRWLPYMTHLASRGDYSPLAELVIDLKRGFRALRVGQLLSVVCPADVARIDPEDIPPLHEGTLFGDSRVRQTIAICKRWPRGRMPAGYGDPVVSDIPALIWGGTLDSATRPEWARAAAANLANSRVIIVPGSHTPDGECISSVTRQFLRRGSAKRLKTRCVDRIELPPFQLPE